MFQLKVCQALDCNPPSLNLPLPGKHAVCLHLKNRWRRGDWCRKRCGKRINTHIPPALSFTTPVLHKQVFFHIIFLKQGGHWNLLCCPSYFRWVLFLHWYVHILRLCFLYDQSTPMNVCWKQTVIEISRFASKIRLQEDVLSFFPISSLFGSHSLTIRHF